MTHDVPWTRRLIAILFLGLLPGCAIPLDEEIGDPAGSNCPDDVFQAAREAAHAGDAERLWRLHSTNRQVRLIGEVSPGAPGYEERVELIAEHLRVSKADVASRDPRDLAKTWNLVAWQRDFWLSTMVYGGLVLDWPYAMGSYTAVNASLLGVFYCRENSGWRIDNPRDALRSRLRIPK